MSLVSLSIPNFVSGVSQQPAALKTTTSTDAMDNCWPSIVSGISKRPPTEFVANVGASFTSSAIGSIINRTNITQFMIIIADGDLKVFDLQGNQKTVNFPQGKQYLSNCKDPAASFKFVNIQDTTFILNKEFYVTENNFGELTAQTFVPDNKVYDYASLPDPNGVPVGIVYQLTTDGTYYKSKEQLASTDRFTWNLVAQGLGGAPYGAWSGPSLPVSTAAGQEFYQSYSYTQWVPIWTQYGPTLIPIGATGYNKYVSTQTGFASAAYKYWLKMSAADLVTEANNGRRDPTNMATVFITNSAANTYYNVYMDGTLQGTYLSPTGTDAATSVPGTSAIASALAANLATRGWTCEVTGSTITITNVPANVKMRGTSSAGDKLVKAWRDRVPAFSDLPPNSPEGRILRVSGDMQNNQDDYYVVYHEGRWEETYAWNGGAGLNLESMPWVLMRNYDGTFTFTSWIWRNRVVGDAQSAKSPPLVKNVINDMFLFSNRLCFITDTDLVLSETFRYENFYRTTIATLQDSDPMYLTVSTKNDDTLRHVIPFNKELLIMGDKSQYRFSYQQFVGPKNVAIQYTTSFNVSRKVAPANMGMSAYFVDDAVTYRYGKVFEYFPRPNQQGDDAQEVTEPVPNYIPAGVSFLAASPRMQMLTLGTTGEPGTLFVYKFFWAGDNKVQNCWNRWTFPDCDKVYWAGFVDNYVYVLLNRGSKVTMERIRADEEAVLTSTSARVMLDRLRIIPANDSSMTYNALVNKTYITSPYDLSYAPSVVTTSVSETAVELEATLVNPNLFSIDGDYRAYALLVGTPYEMAFTLSTPYYRKAAQNGQIAVLDGRLDIRYLNLVYNASSYFKVLVQRRGFPDYTVEWTSLLVDDVDVAVSKTLNANGQKRIPIMCNNQSLKLTIKNNSPFNAILQSGEWWATYQPRTKNIG